MCLVNDGVGSRKELTTKGTVMQDRVQEVSLLPSPPIVSSRPECFLGYCFGTHHAITVTCLPVMYTARRQRFKLVSGQHPGLRSRCQNVLRVDGAAAYNAQILFKMC